MQANLINADELETLLQSQAVIVCDCRFSLNDPDAGRAAFEGSHIPGARYVDLERDLSGQITSSTGRHPLPAVDDWIDRAALLGLTGGQKIVVYDHGPGVFAARLWWMLGWIGISDVWLLDGGFATWSKSGKSTISGEEPVELPSSNLTSLKEVNDLKADADEILKSLGGGVLSIVDAREPPRFSGEVEPLDAKAGHIPGAINYHFALNLEDGKFRSRAKLKEAFEQVTAGRNPQNIIHSCGSGVTACHNLFAMEYSGIKGSRLYPGSWSEWIADPSRPTETSFEQ
ncbi:MAG: sulfurtransferase [Arenicellales bacterium]|jgi:thiosulfate/3-mercaptopyruvate sulfurtransferase|nr:sulfurtransferase [Arenicellales bacterium]